MRTSSPRAALLASFLLLAPLASASSASSPAAGWRVRAGDDPVWASPGFDDLGWRAAPLPGTWEEQGLEDLDGIAWFRGTLPLDGDSRRAAAEGRLGLLLGAPRVGAYEVYAGGRLLGRSRGWSSELPFPLPEVFRVPPEAIGRGAGVSLALRVRRIDWIADLDPGAGPVSGTLTLGSYQAMLERTRLAWTGNLLGELPLLILAALFAAAGLYHLRLFSRRHRQGENLWFGLLSLAFAVNTFASTYWIYEVTVSRSIAVRTSDLTGHLAAALAIQFLGCFFSRPIGPWLRAYQLSHVAMAALIGLWPEVRPVLASSPWRSLWLLPLLVMAAVIIVQEVRRGDAEARKIALGGFALIVLQVLELARQMLPLPIPMSLAGFGFAAVLVTMAGSLADRLRRDYDELDRLRLRLEERGLATRSTRD